MAHHLSDSTSLFEVTARVYTRWQRLGVRDYFRINAIGNIRVTWSAQVRRRPGPANNTCREALTRALCQALRPNKVTLTCHARHTQTCDASNQMLESITDITSAQSVGPI